MTKMILIAVALSCCVGSAAADERLTTLNRIPAVAVWVSANDNTKTLGFNQQEVADRVAAILDQEGVALDADSDVWFQVSAESVLLRDVDNPAIGTSTTAFHLRIDCYRMEESGAVLYWSEYRYGGFGGMTAEFIRKDFVQWITDSAYRFAADYVEDHRMAMNE